MVCHVDGFGVSFRSDGFGAAVRRNGAGNPGGSQADASSARVLFRLALYR